MESRFEEEPESFSDVFKRVREKNNPKTEEESTSSFLGRNIAQNAARSAETVLGMPGNLKKAYTGMKDYISSFIPDELKEPKNDREQEELSFFTPPTSSDVREQVTKPLSKAVFGQEEYLEPKSENERLVGDITGDITSFFMPGTGQLKLVTRIGAPILSNLASEGLKFSGVNESTADKAKLGLMLALTLSNSSNPSKFSSERISKAKSLVPEGATANAEPLLKSLDVIKKDLSKGLTVPSKARTLQGVEELSSQVKNGRMDMHSLMDARDHINEWIAEAGGWDVPGSTKKATLRNLGKLKSSIIETVDSNLSSRFPESSKLYESGYQAASVTHQSNAISNMIERFYGKKAASVGAKILFPALATGGAATGLKGAAAGIAVMPLYKTGQVLYRVGKSPVLAKYYQDVITNSLKGNAPAMVKSLDRFDKQMKKEEEKESKGKKLSMEEFKIKFQ